MLAGFGSDLFVEQESSQDLQTKHDFVDTTFGGTFGLHELYTQYKFMYYIYTGSTTSTLDFIRSDGSCKSECIFGQQDFL